MKNRFSFHALLLSALLPLLGIPATGRAAPEIPSPVDALALRADEEGETGEETPPSGLAESDWSGIRAAHEEWKHRFRQGENGGFTARNPGQQWDSEFDGRGFLVRPDHGGWQWGLDLRGYGIGAERVPVAGKAAGFAGSAEGLEGKSRLAFRRDARLEEWFLNDARGLEQGWTLSERPGGAVEEMLSLDFSVRGGLRPEVTGRGLAVRFVDDSGAAALSYGGLKAWDAEGRALAVRFVDLGAGEGQPDLRIEVDERGAVYPVTIDPVAQQAYLKASNTDAGDNFGHSVSVSGDTVVVGAWGESSYATGVDGDESDNSATSSGAAYVFARTGGTWAQQAYLKASNTRANDRFGSSLSVSGATVVVATPLESSSATGVDGNQADISASHAGAAYVFVLPTPPAPAISTDTIRPRTRLLKRSSLRNPRGRHRIRGTASDNVAVARVEVRSRLQRGWRQARLRASGRWIYRTPRLESGRNVFRVRAVDTSGNRSRILRVIGFGR